MRQFLVFDLDDTLIPSRKIYELALRKIGITMKGAEYQKARLMVKERLGEHHPSARNRFLYFKTLLENKKKFSPLRLMTLYSRYEKALAGCVKAEWKRLKRDRLMQKLARHYDLAILTNENTRMQTVKILSIDPKSHYFRTIVTSEDAGAEKPADTIFDLLLTQLGNPDPEQMIMIGDSYVNDIQPAERRGWNTIWTHEFLDDTPATEHASVKQVRTLDEVLPILLP